MSSYSSVPGLPDSWDIATSPWDKPLRLTHWHADGSESTLYLNVELARRVLRRLGEALKDRGLGLDQDPVDRYEVHD